MGIILQFLGYLCYLFGMIDFLVWIFGYDITGISISPMIAGLLGFVLSVFGKMVERWQITRNPHYKRYTSLQKDERYLQALKISQKEYNKVNDWEVASQRGIKYLEQNGVNNVTAEDNLRFLIAIEVLSEQK